MIDMSDEARQQVSTWVQACLEYWSNFDPTARITEDMVDAQPMPPDGFLMDASAVLMDALARVVEMNRTGNYEPTVESRLAVSELIDQGVTNALDGMPMDGRRAVTRRLWDALLDQTDGSGDGS